RRRGLTRVETTALVSAWTGMTYARPWLGLSNSEASCASEVSDKRGPPNGGLGIRRSPPPRGLPARWPAPGTSRARSNRAAAPGGDLVGKGRRIGGRGKRGARHIPLQPTGEMTAMSKRRFRDLFKPRRDGRRASRGSLAGRSLGAESLEARTLLS